MRKEKAEDRQGSTLILILEFMSLPKWQKDIEVFSWEVALSARDVAGVIVSNSRESDRLDWIDTAERSWRANYTKIELKSKIKTRVKIGGITSFRITAARLQRTRWDWGQRWSPQIFPLQSSVGVKEADISERVLVTELDTRQQVGFCFAFLLGLLY